MDEARVWGSVGIAALRFWGVADREQSELGWGGKTSLPPTRFAPLIDLPHAHAGGGESEREARRVEKERAKGEALETLALASFSVAAANWRLM